MKTTLLSLSMLLVLTLPFSACKKDDNDVNDPHDHDESELITRCNLVFTDSAGTAPTVTALFSDADGEGGLVPISSEITLLPNKTYLAKVELLDESKSPVSDITAEVSEEADDHLFVYKPSGVDVKITITDKDSKNLPLGIYSKWRTGNAGKGKTTIILKHQPGIKNGTEAPGDTDLEIVMTTEIKN